MAYPSRRPGSQPRRVPTSPRRRDVLLPEGEAVHSQARTCIVGRSHRFAGPRRCRPSAAFREPDGGHYVAEACRGSPHRPYPGACRRQRRAARRSRRSREGLKVSCDRTQELADANTELRVGLDAREKAAQVLTDRTQELADANAELRAGLDAREKAAQVLTDRTQELADANAELQAGTRRSARRPRGSLPTRNTGAGRRQRRTAGGLDARGGRAESSPSERGSWQTPAPPSTGGLDAREKAAQILTDRTRELAVRQCRTARSRSLRRSREGRGRPHRADTGARRRQLRAAGGLDASREGRRRSLPRPNTGAGRRQRRTAGLVSTLARRPLLQVLTDRTQELADANAELRAGLAAREQAAQVLTGRTQELADANAELRAGLAAREQAAQVLTERTQELAVAHAEHRAGLDAREAAQVSPTEHRSWPTPTLSCAPGLDAREKELHQSSPSEPGSSRSYRPGCRPPRNSFRP